MNNGEITIYQNSEGTIKIDVRLEEAPMPLLRVADFVVRIETPIDI